MCPHASLKLAKACEMSMPSGGAGVPGGGDPPGPPTPGPGQVPTRSQKVPKGSCVAIFRSKWPSEASSNFDFKFRSNFHGFGCRVGPICESKWGPKLSSPRRFSHLGVHLGTEMFKKLVPKPFGTRSGDARGTENGHFVWEWCNFQHIRPFGVGAPLGSVPGSFWAPVWGSIWSKTVCPGASVSISKTRLEKCRSMGPF